MMYKKKLLKDLMPPVLWRYMTYLRNYYNFLNFRSIIRNNINLKDIHKGHRCFILGSAPSIREVDLKPLRNEIVIALNNFYVHEDFSEIVSGNAPKYYMVAPIHPPQTEDEWKAWLQDMEIHIPKNVIMLFGLNAYRYNIRYIVEKYNLFRKHKIYWYYGGIEVSKDYVFKKNHIDFCKPIWAASTVSTYALLIAEYMGFSQCYLLGIDHNYICIDKEENYRFYRHSIHQQNEHKRMGLKKSDELFGTAKVFLEKELIAENCKIKIFNCSSQSLLNMFEKVEFYKVINAK